MCSKYKARKCLSSVTVTPGGTLVKRSPHTCKGAEVVEEQSVGEREVAEVVEEPSVGEREVAEEQGCSQLTPSEVLADSLECLITS